MSTDQALLDQVTGLRGDVQSLTSAWRKSRLVSALLGLLCVGLVAAVALIGYNFKAARDQASCVRAWANAYAARTNTLVPLSTARQNALDALVLSLQTHDRSKFEAAYTLYVKASADYSRAATDNPPPTAPQYTC